MSVWEDQYENNPIHQKLLETIELLGQKELESDDIDIVENVYRIKQILDYVRNSLKRVNPALINVEILNNMIAPLNKIFNDIQTYITDSNPAHLSNVQPQATSLLQASSQLPIPITVDEAESLTESIIDFRKSAVSSLEKVKEHVTTLTDKIEGLEGEISADKERIEEHSKSIESQKQRLDTLSTEFQKQFTETQESRANKFNTFLEVKGQDVGNLIESSTADARQFAESLKQESKDVIAFLEKKKDEARKLVQVIGNVGVTGNYQKIANYHKWAAEILRGVALVIMGIMVWIIASVAFDATTDDLDWKLVVFRMFAVLLMSAPAYYAANESSKHRKSEMRNRKAELELASIDPFIELLDEEKKKDLKEKLAERFFCQPEIADLKGDDIPKESLFALIEKVVTTLLKSK